MEATIRKPFQGVGNIIRFNWHYYVIAAIGITAMVFARQFLPPEAYPFITIFLFLFVLSMLLSLAASWYVYDHSGFYKLDWLDGLEVLPGQKLVNITAGFDETSQLLKQKYPGSTLTVFDFYDPARHTEVSIKRARKAYPAYPGTETITTANVPLAASSADHIFLILAAHEIRNPEERSTFFMQLGKALQPGGKVIVTEHQRDINNFIAYNIGFLHFHSGSSWKQTFEAAGLVITRKFRINPFLTTYILSKIGAAS